MTQTTFAKGPLSKVASRLISLAAATLLTAVSAQAQVDVVESSPVGGGNSLPRSSVSVPEQNNLPLNAAAESFYQLQLLQQEVLELRGLLEEQAYQLKRLKQQRTDDYLDLDRRISALGAGGLTAQAGIKPAGGASARNVDGPSSVGLSTGGASGQGSEEESSAYRSAYNLLKQRQVDKAITAFSDLLIDHPEGQYAANAHYWLGEIFLLKNDLESARQWFTRLLEGFPLHRKVSDAQFKLGKVYDLLGDKAKARTLLETVAASNADASRLAKKYLEENFQ